MGRERWVETGSTRVFNPAAEAAPPVHGGNWLRAS